MTSFGGNEAVSCSQLSHSEGGGRTRKLSTQWSFLIVAGLCSCLAGLTVLPSSTASAIAYGRGPSILASGFWGSRAWVAVCKVLDRTFGKESTKRMTPLVKVQVFACSMGETLRAEISWLIWLWLLLRWHINKIKTGPLKQGGCSDSILCFWKEFRF